MKNLHMKTFPFPLRPLALALAVASLAACTTTPYRTPELTVPERYGSPANGTAMMASSLNTAPGDIAADPWWQTFNDDGLDRVIQHALDRNNDLAAATLRVRRAQLSAGLSNDALWPHLSGSMNAGYGKNLKTGDSNGRSNSASLGVSYEIDLWNRLGLAADAAQWEAQATAEDRQATALALVGTTAQAYWNLAYLNQRLAFNAQSLARTRKLQALVQTQFDAGQVSRLELREADSSLQNQIATRSQLEQQRHAARETLALLLDGEHWPENDEPQDLSAPKSAEIATGLPAQLLSRRPDLRAAELRLKRSLANVDVTRLSFYPTLNINGSVASGAPSLSDVLKNPVATLGAGLALPFLRFNERKLDIAIANTDYELATTQFRQTLLKALSDVDVALSARDAWNTQVDALTVSFDHARELETLYEVRYRAGATPLRTWLDAQESRRNAELSLAQARLSQLQNDVTLYQSLGGSARAGL